MNQFVIKFPWPPRELSPNARTHWAQKARVVRKCRYDAGILTLQALLKGMVDINSEKVERVDVSFTFTPPDKRPRDEDNLIASMKPFLDGMAEKLGVNDKKFHYLEVSFTAPKRPAFVTALVRIIQ